MVCCSEIPQGVCHSAQRQAPGRSRQPCRVAFVSDLHVGPTTPLPLLRETFDVVRRERADVLLLGGTVELPLRTLAPPAVMLLSLLRPEGAGTDEG